MPLVLVHDGGGTCYSYWCLNPIGRPVYGIHNPHFHSGDSWPGGLPEMARHYVALMRQVVPRGRILLGGWSLGGLLSLEMASILADDTFFTVTGIVMIDSICPVAFKTTTLEVVPFKHEWSKTTKQETRIAVERCFEEATKMVAQYDLPKWEVNINAEANEKRPSTGPPPAILLRAEQAVPVQPGGVSRVDVARGDRHLGWDLYRSNMFNQVVDIPGHHFNIFAMQYIDNVSEKLKMACDTLERSNSSW